MSIGVTDIYRWFRGWWSSVVIVTSVGDVSVSDSSRYTLSVSDTVRYTLTTTELGDG